MKRTLLAAAAVALLASACGSTAQTHSTVTTGLEPGSGSGLTDAGMPTSPGDGGTGSTGVVGATGGSVVGTSGGSGSGGAAGAMLPGTGSAATGATSLPSQAEAGSPVTINQRQLTSNP